MLQLLLTAYNESNDTFTGGVATERSYTTYTYNSYGQEIQNIVHDSSSNQKATNTTTYITDPDSHLFGALLSFQDAIGSTTRYFYDHTTGKQTALIQPDGNGVSYTYDAIGNLIEVSSAKITTENNGYVEEENGVTVSLSYEDITKRLSTLTTATTTYHFTYDIYGNMSHISIENQNILSYTYQSNNGKLSTLTYANGLTIRYTYDDLDRISTIEHKKTGENNFETIYSYTYDAAGNLFSISDLSLNETTIYEYDINGKLTHYYVYDSENFRNLYGSSIVYDEQSKVRMIFYNVDYACTPGSTDVVADTSYYDSAYTSYHYDSASGNLHTFTYSGPDITGSILPIYDTFNRLVEKTIHYYPNETGEFYNHLTFDYKTNGVNESTLISYVSSSVGKTAESLTKITSYEYIYDLNGNITQTKDAAGIVQLQYAYDSYGQMIREDNRSLNKTFTYTYDKAGNILFKKQYAFTLGTLGTLQDVIACSYNHAVFGDALTSIAGNTITYDALGNPTKIEYIVEELDLSYGYNLTWSGSELITYSYFEKYGETIIDNNLDVSYTYNANGIRTSKTINGVRHRYTLDGEKIISEKWVENDVEHLLIYLYDEKDMPIGIKYRNSTYVAQVYNMFFFEKNVQGDIIAIYNEDANQIGAYLYDAWGTCTTLPNQGISSLEQNIVSTLNPFRYRGYYYDVESELYYLRSRYYNSKWGRFISADGITTITTSLDGLSDKNLYAYCDNNPVMRRDDGGEFWSIAIGAVVGAVFNVASCVVSSLITGEDIKAEELIYAGITGAIEGALTGAGLGGVATAASAVFSAGETLISEWENWENGDATEKASIAVEMVVSAGVSAMFSATSEPFDVSGFRQLRKDALKKGVTQKATKKASKKFISACHKYAGESLLDSALYQPFEYASTKLLTGAIQYSWGLNVTDW